MTTTELLTAIVTGATVTAEMEAEAKSMLEKRAKGYEARKARAGAKKSAEDAPLIALAREALADHAPHTASDVAITLDVSTSKATALLKKVEGVVIGETRIKSRVVKTYTLAE